MAITTRPRTQSVSTKKDVGAVINREDSWFRRTFGIRQAIDGALSHGEKHSTEEGKQMAQRVTESHHA